MENGTYTTFTYDTDPRYRVTGITHKNSSNQTLAAITYDTRDKVGNPLEMEDWTGDWSYGYDAMSRLTSATAPTPVPGQPAGGSGALAYGYDWVGNRIHPPSGSNPMVYNKADQLTAWPGMHQYAYYPDGSLHHVLNAGGTSTLASYTYTPDGLLGTASYNGRTLTNTWDADSQRVGMNANGAEYEFVYDVTAGIPAVIESVGEGSTSTTVVSYFREPGGSLIARVEDSSVHYYHFDALGSTRLLTNDDQDITDKYAYDAYGSLLAHDRTADSVDQPYQYVGQLGYYTHWQEPEFGLLQLGVRFYDPQTGRFTQPDPLGEEANSYAYVDADPTGSVDPAGEKGNDGGKKKPPKKPKPKKPKPEDPGDKAMKALGKWFMKSMLKVCTKNCPSGPEIKLGMGLYSLFEGLPQKFRHALDVCINSAKEICNDRNNEGLVWSACMECYNAFIAAAGEGAKGNYYGSLISCEKLVEPRK